MNPEEIKVGNKINIEALVIRKLHSEEQLITCELPTGLQFHIWQRDFEALSPANGIKNTEPAPKYDPCRKFRAGDIVEPCQVKGRWLSEAWKNSAGVHFTVATDEDEIGTMCVKYTDSVIDRCADAVYFQLVTPVEELEPYSVHESDTINGFDIMRDGLCVMTFPYGPKEAGYYRNKLAAKEAADAECDRLNAEYRKEQNNG